jgi:hypothetical protein
MWLLPSLNRPQNLARFFGACRKTEISTKGLVLIDIDDHQANVAAYQDVFALAPKGWLVTFTRGRTQGDKIREVWDEIKDEPWLGLIGDDCVPETRHWDQKLVEQCDPWGIVSCNDAFPKGWQAPKRLANCWVMGGDLVRAVGYIFPPGLHHMFVDDIWEQIGRTGECWTCDMSVLVSHKHVMLGVAPADATHRAAYGDGFSPHHPGPDRGIGLWAGDERVYKDWVANDWRRIMATLAEHKASKPVALDPKGVARFERARSRIVMIGTPIARAPCYEYSQSMIETVAEFERAGIRWLTQFIVGSSNVARVRNEICARFLASQATDLIFIDDDMAWSASSVIRLLASDQPLIAGVGRKRVDKPNSDADVWCFKPLPDAAAGGELRQDDFGAVEVGHVGAAFLKIERRVLEGMAKAHPDWKRAGRPDMPDNVRAAYHQFFKFDEGGQEMGEDYVFCERARACGFEVWIDPKIALGHKGDRLYSGCVGELMQAGVRREAAE